MTFPTEQMVDAQKLQADAYVDLYEIQLYPTGSMFFCATQNATWQGDTYEFWGFTMVGVGSNSDDQTNRPKLSIANFTYDVDGVPIRGVFSALHAQNKVEGATLIRNRVLKANLDADQDIKTQMRWKVSQIASLKPDVVVLELRNTLDGPRFTIPARKFVPPDFPQVKLY